MTKAQLTKKAIELKDQGKTRKEILDSLYFTKFTRPHTVWNILDQLTPNA